MGATEATVQWVRTTGYDDVPELGRQVASTATFDALGCMLLGVAQPHGRIMTDYVGRMGGAPEATVVGTALRVPTAQAAFANGMLGHSLDYDDSGMASHAASILLAASLAVGEKIGASGRDIIEAHVVAREVAHALGRIPSERRGFHSMAVWGRIGAALACSKLMRLGKQETVMALGIVGSMASGVVHNHGTMTKPLHSGLAARDGVIAAELAAMGWTAGDRILEHPAGFMAAFRGEGADLFGAIDSLGKPFRILDSVNIKKYACGYGNHPQIDALLALMKEHHFDYRDVEEVEVFQSYESDYTVRKPRTGLEAKFSMVYIPAATLVQGYIDVDTFTDERIKDPRILETMGKVRLQILDKWEVGLDRADRRWPGGSSGFSSRGIQVRLTDGRVFNADVPPEKVLGHAKNPWGMDNIRAKFESNARAVLPEAKVQEAVKVWSNMEAIKDVREAVGCVVPDA